ncbi:hypothetical protein AYJ54_41345 [Bradyrhizobium centrolobii]|uniref:Major facilitator superfamily (MFS) profile domain-containing protein n=1 Tax=Bradyrhizobium centrolobii TaxID=1505087 RepID=A0A176Z3X9_9BRAD|nr:hypothetical protein AYJ54_41345 [Bradyrhizobium centrolobii]
MLITFLDRLAWANANLLASKSLGLPLAELGVFVTAFYVGYVAANALAGFVTDRIGSRRMLFLALAPLAAATFMFGFTSSFAMGLALQAMMGVFAGADYAAGVKILASWFEPSERGRALGLYLTAPSIGVILANAVFPSALDLVDWRALYWGLGALTAIGALTCLVALTDSPDEMVRNATGMPSTDSGDWRRGLSLVARNKNLVLIAIAGFGANWGTWGFAFWATALMVRGHQLTRVDAGAVTAIFGVAAAVAKPLYGYLSDRLGGKRRSLVIYDLIGFCIMLVVFGQIESKGAFLLAAPLLGVTAFIYSPLLAALITESVDRS